jgi:hypothetical protein
MAQKIIDSIANTFTPDFIQSIALQLNEPVLAVQRSIDISTKLIFIGLQKRTASSEGANLVIKLAYEQHSFDIVPKKDAFFGTESAFWLSRGRGLVRSLFGIKAEKIIGTIKEYTQLNNSSTKSLLGITSSIIMDLLGEFALLNKLNSCDVSILINEINIVKFNNTFTNIDVEAIFATPLIDINHTPMVINKQGILNKTWQNLQQVFSIIF